jgi:hypothetical protein
MSEAVLDAVFAATGAYRPLKSIIGTINYTARMEAPQGNNGSDRGTEEAPF